MKNIPRELKEFRHILHLEKVGKSGGRGGLNKKQSWEKGGYGRTGKMSSTTMNNEAYRCDGEVKMATRFFNEGPLLNGRSRPLQQSQTMLLHQFHGARCIQAMKIQKAEQQTGPQHQKVRKQPHAIS